MTFTSQFRPPSTRLQSYTLEICFSSNLSNDKAFVYSCIVPLFWNTLGLLFLGTCTCILSLWVCCFLGRSTLSYFALASSPVFGESSETAFRRFLETLDLLLWALKHQQADAPFADFLCIWFEGINVLPHATRVKSSHITKFWIYEPEGAADWDLRKGLCSKSDSAVSFCTFHCQIIPRHLPFNYVFSRLLLSMQM